MKKSNLYVLGSIEAIIGSIIICITSIIKELSFPETILRMIFRFKDVEFYNTSEDDEISDEALGI